MLCKYCGAQLPDGTVKCEFCGAELAEEQAAEEATEEIVDETVDETIEEEEILDENEIKRRAQMEKMMAEKQQQLSEIEKRRNIKKKRQRQTKIAIICAICAACIAVVGFGSYTIKNSLNKPQATAVPTVAPTVVPTLAVPTPLTTTPVPLGTSDPMATPKMTLNNLNTSDSSEIRSVGSGGGSSSSSGSGSSSSSTSTGSGSSSGSGGSSSSSNTGSGSSSGSGGSSSSSNTGNGSSSSGSGSSASSAKPTGISTSRVNAQLTTGGEVIKNSDTGRYLMTFTAGNTLYYANVSEGSTTEQIKDKNITITAHPTAESYKGNTVYEITSMTYYDDSDYIIANSGTKLLSKDDVKNMSKQQLALARNEIYARHGRRFQMAEFRDYFSKKAWYKENPNYNYDNENANLNEIESKNAVFLLSVENSR